jgi:CBS-domain-containing membrane protein
MKQMPGYIDVFADDFRVIYHHAHRHAVRRLTAGLRADKLMRANLPVLLADMPLTEAVQTISQSGCKGLAVVDRANKKVTGILTETGFLRHLGCGTLFECLQKTITDKGCAIDRLLGKTVADTMTSPAVCVAGNAGFEEIFRAYHVHGGRQMPVIDEHGAYVGMLLRKDFLTAVHLEQLL